MAMLEIVVPAGYHPGVWGLQKYVKAKMGHTSLKSVGYNPGTGLVSFAFEYVS